MKTTVTNSIYLQAFQCPAIPWMHRNCPTAFNDTVIADSRLEAINDVRKAAYVLFGCRDTVKTLGYRRAAEETLKLIKEGKNVIANAVFMSETTAAAADLIVSDGENIKLYLIKSSAKVKNIYIEEAAYQHYVLKKCGYNVTQTGVVIINHNYVRTGDIDVSQVLTVRDITAETSGLVSGGAVEKRVGEILSVMSSEDKPQCELGMHCFTPYDCGFFGECSKALPHPNVFDVHGMQLSDKEEYYRKGSVTFSQLENEAGLESDFRLQIEHEIHDIPDRIDAVKIQEFMSSVRYPLYFLDFESYQPAIPLYDGTKPFEQIVFQYSLHHLESENAGLKHTEYLGQVGKDPRRKLAEQLCRDIPENVCIAVYNMSFEKGRIKHFAEIYPDLRDHLMNIHDHIIDLMIPFRDKLYYNSAMKGSYSIKYVLPALYPGVPELDYTNLDGIHNGEEAASAYAVMNENTPHEEVENVGNQLLKYCELDTLAMVRVYEKLKQI